MSKVLSHFSRGYGHRVCLGGYGKGSRNNPTSTLTEQDCPKLLVQVMEALGLTYPIFTCQALHRG